MLDFSDKDQSILNVFNFKTNDSIFSEAKQIIVTDGFNLQTKHRKSGSQKESSWTDISLKKKKGIGLHLAITKQSQWHSEEIAPWRSFHLDSSGYLCCEDVFDEHRS